MLYVPVAFYYFMMNTLIMSDIVDNIPPVFKLVSKADGSIDRIKLIVLRMSIVLVCVLIAVGSNSVIGVLDICGSIFSPLGSFIVPVKRIYRDISLLELLYNRENQGHLGKIDS